MDTPIMQEILIFAGVLAIILVILVELVKRTIPSVPPNLFPLIAIVLGVIVGALADPFTDLEIVGRLWAGFFAGASACGLFDLATKTAGKRPDDI